MANLKSEVRSRKSSIVFRGLHAGQQEVLCDAARFKVLSAGRRWGKTRLGVAAALKCALEGGRAWWVAPIYAMTQPAWRELKGYARGIPGAVARESDLMLRIGGGWAQVKSAEEPETLRGEGLDLAVLDEAAYIAQAAWTESLRPALSDRLGGALFISTPAGRNWFWELFNSAGGDERNGSSGRNGSDGKTPISEGTALVSPSVASLPLVPSAAPGNADWRAWRWPTGGNPFIRADEIAAAQASLPERTFRQEYLAEFVGDGGGVFRRVIESATARPQAAAAPGHEYVIGADWGKHFDFTVFAVLDATERALVALDRFNRIDYALQTQRLKALCERFNPAAVVAESNAMGDPICEQLVREGLPVVPFHTTQASKARAVESLALAFERGELRLLDDPALIGELQAFEAARLPSGLLRYGAPEGAHDDCVMALALAWSAAAENASGPGIGFL